MRTFSNRYMTGYKSPHLCWIGAITTGFAAIGIAYKMGKIGK